MGKIQVLDEHMTNLIAAGEVIERCSSVVKELVENSIDAGATKINISLIDSGLNEIRVADNGCGMDTVDAKMAVLPHATSKIRNQNDLFTISTLGFRGEALASIVAVSNFRLITSVDGFHGLMLSIKGGVPITEATISHPKGTEIVVKNLFFNTPARLQNLQNANVELSYITDLVSKIALSKPEIAFTLVNNNKTILQTSGNGNLLEVISEVYSNDIAKEMVDIFDDNGIFKINGYISKISVTRSSKSNIVLLINGRLVHNNQIVNAIVNGYGNLLMNGKFPIAVININVDLSMVDVNVHPSKYEVRLSDESTLKEMLVNIINKTLLHTNLSVNVSYSDDNDEKIDNEDFIDNNYNQENEVIEEQERESTIELEDEKLDESVEINEEINESIENETVQSDTNLFDYLDNNTHNENKVNEKEFDLSSFEKEEINEYDSINDSENNDQIELSSKETEIEENKYVSQSFSFIDDETITKGDERLSKLFYIGQLFGTYILAQNESTFFLIDQHAANERINYEKIKNNLIKNLQATYELLIPFTLAFTPAEIMIINEKMDVINNLGIKLEDFGNNTFIVREIPIWIFKGKEKEFVEEIITKVVQDKANQKEDFLDSLAKSLACKKSIKGNEFHSDLEIEYLLNELVRCENPFTCPHGRPIIVKISHSEVEKWFKRIVD